MATKPLMPSALRAFTQAAFHLEPYFAYNFLPLADIFLETILPLFDFMRCSFFRPLTVLVSLPLNTAALANLYTFFFIAFFFIAMDFMTFIAFMDFIAIFIIF